MLLLSLLYDIREALCFKNISPVAFWCSDVCNAQIKICRNPASYMARAGFGQIAIPNLAGLDIVELYMT